MCKEDNCKTVCNNLSFSMEKLTQPAILLLLAENQAHGYDLIQKLNHLDCIDGELEAATVYRTLRRMEREGLISSQWEHGEFGPARRQYRLTDEGRKSLNDWVIVLKARMKQIEILISHYDKTMN
ncbi:MAG: helix-turn-helix transcriptional regulator [Firmicutes bacterium]|nr:helix-turn-helix transcriptional regulator [Bacillota bacterium]